MRASWKSTIGVVIAVCFGADGAIAATCGLASYYHEGQRTANGERFRPLGMTAAHRTMKFGTMIRVTSRGNVAVVRINDRGPFVKGRVLDLSLGAARVLGMVGAGVAKVCYDIQN